MYNFIDRNGEILFKKDFTDYVTLLNKDRLIHKSGDKYGILDRHLNVVVKHEYPYIQAISVDRVAIAKDTAATRMKDYLYGLYDSDGNVILPMEYERISPESEGLIAVKKNGKIGFVDRDGKLRIDFINARNGYVVHGFVDGIAAIVSHRYPLLSNIKLFDRFTPRMLKTTVINAKGETIFSTGGYPKDYSQGIFLIYKGKEKEFVLATRSGDIYSLPNQIFPEGQDSYLKVELNNGVIIVPIVKRRYLNDPRVFPKAYGLFKFTIKEK